MTTDTLAKQYACLTPRERLPLLEAALTCDDETESNRLIYSAPTACLRVRDYLGYTAAIETACFLYMLDQLDLATCYWRAERLHRTVAERNFHEWNPPRKNETAAREAREDRLYDLVRFFAYRIVTHAEAWKRLCAELSLDPDELLSHSTGYNPPRQAVEPDASETRLGTSGLTRKSGTDSLRPSRIARLAFRQPAILN